MHKPTDITNFAASGAIAARRIVCLAANASASQASDVQGVNLGVTELACEAGAHVDVAMGGIVEVEAGQNLRCGDWITADGDGKAVHADEGCAALGVAIDDANNGEYVTVRIAPSRPTATVCVRQGFEASGAISGGRIVKIGTNGKISQASASSDTLVGVIVQEAADGDMCDAAVAGIAWAEAGAAINAGALITADSSGKAVTASAGDNYIGMALAPASGDDALPISLHIGSLPAAVQQGG